MNLASLGLAPLAALFVVMLAALLAVAELFTRCAQRAGAAFGWGPFFTGAILVGIGTSLPELASSVAAVAQGQTQIVPANVVGSNIANITLGLGLALLVLRGSVRAGLGVAPRIFFAAATALGFVVVASGDVSRTEGLVLLGLGCLFLFHSFVQRSADPDETRIPKDARSARHIASIIGGLLAGGAGVAVLGDGAIRTLLALSAAAGVPPEITAALALAVGTSLPEIAVMLPMALRGRIAMALGNIVGSCVVNIALVMGISALIVPLSVAGRTGSVGGTLLLVSGIGLFAALLALRRGGRALFVLVGGVLVGLFALFAWGMATGL